MPELVKKDVPEISKEDLKFIVTLKNATEIVGGHYQISLPIENDEEMTK